MVVMMTTACKRRGSVREWTCFVVTNRTFLCVLLVKRVIDC